MSNKEIWEYRTKESVNARALEAVHKTLGEICEDIETKSKKGGIGTAIENDWFHIYPGSFAGPDFNDAGVELKVTGYIKDSTGKPKAKERLVLNIINYEEEWNKEFYNSSFWKKNQCLQIIVYHYDNKKPKAYWTIDGTTQFEFPLDDLEIIKSDYNKIIAKIKNGEAHTISEGDTLYLKACTKGATSESMRKQPFSEKLAKQRAYSLKQSYLTYIIQNYIFGEDNQIEYKKNSDIEKLIKSEVELSKLTFEEVIFNKVKPYIGMTNFEILARLGAEYNEKYKSMNELIISRILGLKGNINQAEEIKKANINVKTIRVNSKGRIKESMSFPAFDPVEISNQTWEESDFYEQISRKFLFVVFEIDDKDKNIQTFKGIKFWNMPYSDMLSAQDVWETTSNIFRNHKLEITEGPRGTSLNLPTMAENYICHVRPKARDSSDTILTPQGDYIVKRCFWLGNKYIEEQIKDLL